MPNNFSKAAKRKNLNPRPIKAKRINADEMALNNKMIFIELNTANITIEGKVPWHLSGHKIKWQKNQENRVGRELKKEGR